MTTRPPGPEGEDRKWGRTNAGGGMKGLLDTQSIEETVDLRGGTNAQTKALHGRGLGRIGLGDARV